jgi:ABC-type transport system involved in multi-copper enzyme maturation permease subunit
MARTSDPESQAPLFCGLATVAIVFGLFLGHWYGWLAVVLGVGLLLLSCYSREDGFLLFGPFPKYDALANVRGRRTHLIRAGVALGAVALFYFQSNIAVTQSSLNQTAEFLHSRLINEIAVILGVAVPLLTLFFVPGMIIEERSSKRWDVLLTTDLRAREIVFGKLLGRLWLVLEPVVVLIPVFAILPLIVGLSPAVMLIYGTAVLLTMLALSGIAVHVSTWRESRMGGVFWVFAIVFLYLVLSLFISIYPSTNGFSYPLPIQVVTELLSSANPYVTYLHVVKAPSTATPADMAAALQQYSAGTIGVFLGGMLFAASRLRGLEQAAPPSQPQVVTREKTTPKSAAYRPPVTDEPLTWWLVAGSRFFGFTPLWLFALFMGTLGICLLIHLYTTLFNPGGYSKAQGLAELLIVVSVVIPLVVPIGLATASIAKERSGDTFEILRTTPLTSQEMLDQYRAGAMKVHYILMLLWAIPTLAAVLTSFFRVFTAIVFLVVPLVTMPHLISGALYCSARADTPARAFRNLIFFGVGWHFVIFWVGLILIIPIPDRLGLSMDLIFQDRTDPWEMLFPTGRLWWVNPRTLHGDILTCLLSAAGLIVYWLLGRWVYRRAFWRFDQSR